MASSINASLTAGVVTTADTSGVLALQTNGTTAVTVDASQNTTLAGTLTTTGITNSGVATATRFNPTGSSVTGNGMYLPAANSVGISTNGTNAVYIDASQNVGIGTSSPTTKLTISGTAATGATTFLSTGTTTNYNVGQFTNTGGNFYFGLDNNAGTAFANSSAYGGVVGTGNSTNLGFVTNSTVRATLDTSGNLTISNGNLIVGTAGKGIDFSVTSSGTGTMTSELLSDYEEGTWNPGVTFGGLAVGVTFAGYQGGTYTKIGNRVFFTAQMRLTSKGTSVGTASITGLPFTSAGANPGIPSVCFFVDTLTYVNSVGGQVDFNSATISIYSMVVSSSSVALTNVEFFNTTNIKMMGHYYT